MVALGQEKILVFGGFGRQRECGFNALAPVIGRTAIPQLRKNNNPAAKCVGTDL